MFDEDSESDTSCEGWSLRDVLTSKMCRSMFDATPHKFLPEGEVDAIITTEAVKKTIDIDEFSSANRELVNFIMTRAKKAFAIVVYTKSPIKKAMEWFLSKNIDDSQLPIRVQTTRWTTEWRGDFYDYQWQFFAPVFDTSKYIQTFEEARILPFVSMSLVSDEGAFGEVSWAKIHERHMIPRTRNQCESAVKRFNAQHDKEEVAEQWKREVEALRMMNELNQPHILRFITAFRRLKRNGEERYVMFEWAAGGNLRRMWKETPTLELTGSLVRLVVEQLLGLATALSAAHMLGRSGASYRHGDLRPENILVFPNGSPVGTLKIGNWGEAKYQGRLTTIGWDSGMANFGTRRYEAPEVETGIKAVLLGQSTQRRSRLGDLWSMGCIMLEFLIWLLYGWRGLEQFNNDISGDKFYQMTMFNGKKVAYVHSAATRWMERMAELQVCELGTTALGDLLDLTRRHLLVVKLPRSLESYLDQPRRGTTSKHESQKTGTRLEHMIDDEFPSRPVEPYTTDVPTFTLTVPEPNEPEDWKEWTTQPDYKDKWPSRCHVAILRDTLNQIYSEDEPGYWDIRHIAPASDDASGQEEPIPDGVRQDSDTNEHVADPHDTVLGEKLETASTLRGAHNIIEAQSETLLGEDDPVSEKYADIEDDDPLDTSSISSHMTTAREKEGKSQIAYVLANDSQLRSLCSRAMLHLGRDGFADEGRKLLRSLYHGLLCDAHTELEKQSVKLLKSRRGRIRISAEIFEIITASEVAEEGYDDSKSNSEEQARMREERLELWAQDYTHTSPPDESRQKEHELMDANVDDWDTRSSDSYSLNPDRSPDVRESQPRIAEIEHLFRHSIAFQILIDGFRGLLLPRSLRDVLPAISVELSDKEDTSISNYIKARIEDFTMVDWDWWPLRPRMRALEAGQRRLTWTCLCGTKLWKEVDMQEIKDIQRALLDLENTTMRIPQCAERARLCLWQRLAGILLSSATASKGGQQQSKTVVSSTPSRVPVGTQATGSGQTATVPSSSVHTTQPSSANRQFIPRTNTSNTSFSRWIILGTQSHSDLAQLDHVEIDDFTNDSRFFRSLREHYRKHRGYLRLWFSVWRVGACDGVRFDRTAPNYVFMQDPELPKDFQEYLYNPKAPPQGDAKNPLIDRHKTQKFLGCDNPCRWKFFHTCVPDLINRRVIESIPRKKSMFEIEIDNPAEHKAWGLTVRLEVSARHVALYHLAILAFPFAFWGWWQALHPGDLQNASVPVTVVLGMLSLFWGTNGILTHGRQSSFGTA